MYKILVLHTIFPFDKWEFVVICFLLRRTRRLMNELDTRKPWPILQLLELA